MAGNVVITGVGMVTPLGNDPGEVLRRIGAGESAAGPVGFDAGPFACRVCAQVKDFHAQAYTREVKMVRLMNRDAQLAVGAAHLALQDAGLTVQPEYAPEDVALFGATGLAGLSLSEVAPLIRHSVSADGEFDLGRFGREGLRSISPLLSFKVLANMPVCFVSICENIQGPNSIYTPWEGQGAQAIIAGINSLKQGEARCALVGGCDVKTHALAFIALEQLGLFQSWKESQTGLVPGEGAVFLVLELEEAARARGASMHARIGRVSTATTRAGTSPTEAYLAVLRGLAQDPFSAAEGNPLLRLAALVGGADGDVGSQENEKRAWDALSVAIGQVLYPKPTVGNLFAAAAALQVGLGAQLTERLGGPILVDCFGYGSEQAAFMLEKP